jgi:hypothetical protein
VSLPDINAETYPFGVVQHALDQAAYLNLFSIPDRQQLNTAISSGDASHDIVGIRVNELLHRFGTTVRPPTQDSGLKATNVVGELTARFSHRWMIMPDDFEAVPERDPPPTSLNPSISQRFVMLDGMCRFDGEEAFRGFGTGQTFPVTIGGRSQLLIAAVGNIIEGFGALKGREGTYTYCGVLVPELGFSGSLVCRVLDPDDRLSRNTELPDPNWIPAIGSDMTYILFRGEKKSSQDKTHYQYGPEGQLEGFKVEQQLRIVRLDSTTRRPGGLCATRSVGPVIGRMTSQVFLNLIHPGAPGTASSPIPFRTRNEYTFIDDSGRTVGSFCTEGGEGRTFNMNLVNLPGQRALRFGAFQILSNGSGCFSGIRGLLTDNSAAGIAPHALSTLYMICINDPNGRYRAPSRPAIDERRRDLERLIDACRSDC